MITVIFEVTPKLEGKEEYLHIASLLRDHLASAPGFISIERYQSLANPHKILSLSFWKDEQSISSWRNLVEHRKAQAQGREALFDDYRIRVANVSRDYSMLEREQTPNDSLLLHGASTKKAH